MAQMRLRRKRFSNIQHRNIFDRELGFSIKTKYVTLLAPGKNGIQGYGFLEEEIAREDNTIIAVNFAVQIAHELNRPYLEPDIWMVSDSRATEQIIKPDKSPWFHKALNRFQGKKIFNLSVAEICWKKFQHPGPYFTYASQKLMKGNDVVPLPYVLRAGGTVLSAGIQADWLFHEHPEKVTLICGGDMSTDDYIRGKNLQKKHGDTWPSVHCLGKVIQDRIKRGSNIYTISDTRLLDYDYIEYYPPYLLWRNEKSAKLIAKANEEVNEEVDKDALEAIFN